MKKVMMLAAFAAALAACQSKSNKTADTTEECLTVIAPPTTEITEIYTGTLPAADGPGIDYVLTLNAAVNDADTVYALSMTYLDAEGAGKHKTFTSKGKQKKIQKMTDKKTITAIELLPGEGNDAPMYFMVVNDSTLRLVNENLQEADSPLNYDIIKMKK